ncbi:serine hydrolase domain-containing protein [Mycolicibacterium chlorophenolicum]|uniref:serine hydrolase domain-containing protein n=1 Tax=Mycolicibacterium chlorophenolicum TaxID=37916 RepID=UPI000653794A|nr:serine hydrolase domain-containing protein [Mycolicibacterium chlorophenolicum]
MTVPRSRHARVGVAAAVLLTLAAAPSCGPAAQPPSATRTSTTTTPPSSSPSAVPPPPVTPVPELAPVADLVTDAIAAHRLPGAVVQIGHAGKIVFRRAFGQRKLDGEPGLDGSPAPAEPMTEDTMFDLASLTKSLATAPAIMQLSEQGRLRVDDPVQAYLPDFNPLADPRRARVTLRMLLTHTSGIAGDLSLDGPWGLDRADKADGIHRALGAWVVFEPGQLFHYSDINFILLGAIVEKLTGQTVDVYARDNVFGPLGMRDTRYLPATKACGPHRMRGTAVIIDPKASPARECPAGTWSTDLLPRIAPTAHDGDTPGLNPDYGYLLRGTVHDPTARRMGGATGSAGVFSTVGDIGLYAQALLDRLAGRPSEYPLPQSAAQLMTSPQQPGHAAGQIDAANAEDAAAVHYPAIPGQDLRGFGWDIDTAHSRPRGTVFPVGSFGHTGFTGTSLWLDPGSDTYVIVLSNVIHQPGGPPIVGLSGDIATTAARALHLYGS